jgi:hypothetical protein
MYDRKRAIPRVICSERARSTPAKRKLAYRDILAPLGPASKTLAGGEL